MLHWGKITNKKKLAQSGNLKRSAKDCTSTFVGRLRNSRSEKVWTSIAPNLQSCRIRTSISSEKRERCTDVVFVAEVHSLQSLPHDALQLSLRNPAEKQTGEAKDTASSPSWAAQVCFKPKTRHTRELRLTTALYLLVSWMFNCGAPTHSWGGFQPTERTKKSIKLMKNERLFNSNSPDV